MTVEIACYNCKPHKDGSPQMIDAAFFNTHNLRAHPDKFGMPEHPNDVQFYRNTPSSSYTRSRIRY